MITTTILTADGEITQHDGTPINAEVDTLLDAMLVAQTLLGQIVWDSLTETIAEGYYVVDNSRYRVDHRVVIINVHRVVIIDVDHAPAKAAIEATVRILD